MFRKVLAALLMVALLAAPAYAVSTLADVTVSTYGPLRAPDKASLPFGLDVETVTNTTAHYGPKADAVPDTVDWDRHGVVLGPANEPVSLIVTWLGETNATFGRVQFKARAIDSETYTWGDVACIAVGTGNVTYEFEVGLWESVRVWLEGSADGITGISATAIVLE